MKVQRRREGMISKRRDCRLMMCTTVLHGRVCHRTSTPHKSGNKMKRKNKKDVIDKNCMRRGM